MKLLYEGKSKKVYEFSKDEVILEFKDSATAFNAQKYQEFKNKGKINCLFSEFFFKLLSENGIKNHFIRKLNDNQMLCRKVEVLKIEVVIRNIATGSITKRLGIESGFEFEEPLIEFFYKDDKLNDPNICKEHIKILKLASVEEVKAIEIIAFKSNEILKEFFKKFNLRLVDIKFEFGRYNNEIILADEISPDVFRVWDKFGNSYDKDVFRFEKGNLIETYEKLGKMIGIL
jgi:phosphoribosylaminoimidazole-succinocarboxamide synthase